MSTRIIPNTFMCFNAYVDRAMQHLTDSELRALVFATRHILGWQDKIAGRQRRISISMFTDGFSVTHADGAVETFAGCGLGRAAAIKACAALATFRLLLPDGEPTNDGQMWTLGDDPDWVALEQRSAERAAANRKRTAKAAQAKAEKAAALKTAEDALEPPSSSDEPLVRGTNHQSVARTAGGTSHGRNQNQVQSQVITTTTPHAHARDEPLPEPPNAFTVWEQEMTPLTPLVADTIRDWLADFPPGWAADAIREAKLAKGVVAAKYVQAILDRWQREGKGSPRPTAVPALVSPSGAVPPPRTSALSPGAPTLRRGERKRQADQAAKASHIPETVP